jgi:hypothetical protein
MVHFTCAAERFPRRIETKFSSEDRKVWKTLESELQGKLDDTRGDAGAGYLSESG